MESNLETNDTLNWESSTPIFQNPIILKQIATTFWMPIVVLFAAISFLTNFALEVVSITSGILLISFIMQIVVFSFYNFNYTVRTTIDNKGILLKPALIDTPKWNTVRMISTFLGIFSRRPGVAGGAILSGSTNGEMIKWEEILEFAPQPDQLAYEVKLSGSRKTVVFCTKENFEEIGLKYKTMYDSIRAEYTKDAEVQEEIKEGKEEVR